MREDCEAEQLDADEFKVSQSVTLFASGSYPADDVADAF
jgi:hypothetical protein